MTRQIVSGHQ